MTDAGSGNRPPYYQDATVTVHAGDWLVRLVTPPGGVCLDPFAGSGTTAEAAVMEGMRCVGIEREPIYLPLIVARLSKPMSVGSISRRQVADRGGFKREPTTPSWSGSGWSAVSQNHTAAGVAR